MTFFELKNKLVWPKAEIKKKIGILYLFSVLLDKIDMIRKGQKRSNYQKSGKIPGALLRQM